MSSQRKAVKGQEDVVKVEGGHRTKMTTTQQSFFYSDKGAREPDGRLDLFKAHIVRTELGNNVNKDGGCLLTLKLMSTRLEQ